MSIYQIEVINRLEAEVESLRRGTPLDQLNKARADALREAAERIEGMANGKSPAAKLRKMADEMEKGK